MAEVFYSKPLVSVRNGAAPLYSWSPGTNDKVVQKKDAVGAVVTSVGCNLIEDNNVTYVYELLFINNVPVKSPYVMCDYVE
jgi:hypothetical protein